MKNSGKRKSTIITHFTRDAAFFANWGMRLVQRNDYDKALRCFQRATDLEPHNPTYLCQMASILAEIGRFEHSNEILHHILDNIDPNLTDIYFYLANNYANMEEFEMAEEMALRYLQADASGMYADEAEELLHYIYVELDLPPRQYLGTSVEHIYTKHEQARKCLEEGRFLEAAECLKQIIADDPGFTPAWNNLSLAYYYIGDFAKSMQTIEETLEQDPGNLHALCNLAVLLFHQNKVTELVPLLSQLKKVVPFNQEHYYKLATTMGVLGQHEEAFLLYRRLLRTSVQHEACTYHYAATSAFLTDRMELAVRWWTKAKQLDPESGIADYYLELVKEQGNGKNKEAVLYHYHHPKKEIKLENSQWVCKETMKTDPMIRASLLWALQHGKEDAIPLVIQTLGMIGDEEAESSLRYFYETTRNEELKKLAVIALFEMGAELPRSDERYASSDPSAIDDVIASIKQQQHAGNAGWHQWAIETWSKCGSKVVKIVQVRKTEAWVAALEYAYAKEHNEKTTQAALSKKYCISTATIAKCYKAIVTLDLYQF